MIMCLYVYVYLYVFICVWCAYLIFYYDVCVVYFVVNLVVVIVIYWKEY